MKSKEQIKGTPANGGLSEIVKNTISKPAFQGNSSEMPKLTASLKEEDAEQLDPSKKQAIKDWVVKKVKPTELFKQYFGSKPITPEQALMRLFDAPANEIPQQVVGLIQRRIKGASTRINKRKNKIQECRVMLKTGYKLEGRRSIALTQEEKKRIQETKLRVEAELIKAKSDLQILRGYLEDALIVNTLPIRDRIKSVRELAFIKRMAPSIANSIIKHIESNPGKKDEFLKLNNDPDAFLNAVKDNQKAHKLLSDKPKLATQVRLRVMEQVKK